MLATWHTGYFTIPLASVLRLWGDVEGGFDWYVNILPKESQNRSTVILLTSVFFFFIIYISHIYCPVWILAFSRARTFSPLSNVQLRCEVQPESYKMYWKILHNRQSGCGMKLTSQLHQMSVLRICRAITPLSHSTSWSVQKQLYLYFYFLQKHSYQIL